MIPNIQGDKSPHDGFGSKGHRRLDPQPVDSDIKQPDYLRNAVGINDPQPAWLTIGLPVAGRNCRSITDAGSGSGYETQLTASDSVEINGSRLKVVFLDQDDPHLGTFSGRIYTASRPDQVVASFGEGARLYRTSGRELVPVEDGLLPHINFGGERRWFLDQWQWLDSDNLLAEVAEPDSSGDEIWDRKLYVYHVATRTLRKVELPQEIGSSFKNPITLIKVDSGKVTVAGPTGMRFEFDVRP